MTFIRTPYRSSRSLAGQSADAPRRVSSFHDAPRMNTEDGFTPLALFPLYSRAMIPRLEAQTPRRTPPGCRTANSYSLLLRPGLGSRQGIRFVQTNVSEHNCNEASGIFSSLGLFPGASRKASNRKPGWQPGPRVQTRRYQE